MQPNQLELGRTIYNAKPEKYRNIWLKGGFILRVPLWRYDNFYLGEIEIPENVIEASELVARIEDFYAQPVTYEILDYVEQNDPASATRVEEFRQELDLGGEVEFMDFLGGLYYLEAIRPDGQGDYRLILGS